MDCSEIVSIAKEFVIAGSALTGAIVAVLGLNTWKQQLKGSVEYELARRCLVTLYRYRDAIGRVRNPAIWTSEFEALGQLISENKSDNEVHFLKLLGVYEARWAGVQTEKAAMYTDLVESEAIWGAGLTERFDKVFSLEQQLLQVIRNYLSAQDPNENAAMKEIAEKNLRQNRWILYSRGNEDDLFEKELTGAVSAIEIYLKPHIRAGKR